jgi:hypothetical protein
MVARYVPDSAKWRTQLVGPAAYGSRFVSGSSCRGRSGDHHAIKRSSIGLSYGRIGNCSGSSSFPQFYYLADNLDQQPNIVCNRSGKAHFDGSFYRLGASGHIR